jgi:acetyl esterase/lipase
MSPSTRFLIAIFVAAVPVVTSAQSTELVDSTSCRVLQNEHYGPDTLNTFDILIPESPTPTPLVVFIHGGGFVQGDKSEPFKRREEDVAYFLKHGIAFASLNYRFLRPDDSVGVGKCLSDVTSALQFLRFNAQRYHIAKDRIACYGSSAGAGLSLYIAFHDDMALPHDTTLRGESTRIRCAGAIATQATYDLFKWEEFIPGLREVINRTDKVSYDAIAHFYGYRTYRDFELLRPEIEERFDMLRMITSDDPPVYLMNLQQSREITDLVKIEHHPAHAEILSKILTQHHVIHETYVYGDTIHSEGDIKISLKEFITVHLLTDSPTAR